jgi:hypothetical protein
VRFRFGESEVEIEGDPKFIDKYLKTFWDRLGGRPVEAAPSSKHVDWPAQIAASAKGKKAPSPAEFYREKNPDSGTETLIVFAKYLEDYRSQPEFKPADINKVAKDAKVKDVHSQYYTYAVKQGLLRPVGKGKYALTLSGEDVVTAMPKKALAVKSSD